MDISQYYHELRIFFGIVLCIAFGLYDHYKKKKKHIKENYGSDDEYRKANFICIAAVILGIISFVMVGIIPESSSEKAERVAKEEQRRVEQEKERLEEKAKREIKEAEEKVRLEKEMIKEITTGWDMTITDVNDSSNGKKAGEIVKKYPQYIKTSKDNYIDVVDAMKQPWNYYGKVVNISGTIYNIEQEPPESNFRKYFGTSCYNAMLNTGNQVYISIFILGNSNDISENSFITVKGYVYGHTTLQNAMGATSKGLVFIGLKE